MTDLTNKRAIVVAPRFFGYDVEIVEEVKRRGADVHFIPDRPFRSALMIAMAKKAARSILTLTESYYRRQIGELAGSDVDIVLVVNGQTLSTRTMRRFRGAFPRARFILWAWDSVRNRPSILRHLDYFDVCATFDPMDAETYGLRFRPSFFAPSFERSTVAAPAYDVSFIGTVHTDRYAVIQRVKSRLPAAVRAFWHLYLQAPWVFWYYRATKDGFRMARKSEFRFDALPRRAVEDIFFDSRAILEIEHPEQRGLTMRTFEAIAAGKKLITTNARIRDYDFFRPSNIHIIDRENPSVPDDFLHSPFDPVGSDFYARYRLSAWLDELLLAATGVPAAL